MIRSFNEVMNMAYKAARGAGVPLGHAEDFGPVVAHMALQAPQQLACLSQVLSTPCAPFDSSEASGALTVNNAQVVIAAPIALDALRAGATSVHLCDVDTPTLLQAYCDTAGDAALSKQGRDFVMVRVVPPAQKPAIGAIEISDKIWSVLSEYAAKTYVPATEASRLAGAGAGLTDND